MAYESPVETNSPSASLIRLPLTLNSRRGSIVSLSSRTPVDKEHLSITLDRIHTSASRSDTLTTFDEFASPPPSSYSTEGKGLTGELVQGGLSGLYSRIRASVSANKESGRSSTSSSRGDLTEGSKARDPLTKPTRKDTKSSSDTIISSPVLVSAPSSQLQSPLASQFSDVQISGSQRQDGSRDSIASPVSLASSKTKLYDSEVPSIPGPSRSHSSGGANVNSRRSSLSESRTKAPKLKNGISSRQSQVGRDSLTGADSVNYTGNTGFAGIGTTASEDEIDSTDEDIVVVVDRGLERIEDLSTVNSRVRSSEESRLAGKDTANSFVKGSQTILTSNGGQDDLTRVVSRETVNPQRPPLIQVSQSHLPGFKASRASSSDGLSSVTTFTASRNPQVGIIEEKSRPQNLNKGTDVLPNSVFSQVQRRVLAKEFWMKDENAKDCFNCGDAFSTFRRKHHCRTCGQIFDAKCTSLVSGNLFGQSSSLRVCKPCEALIYGPDDDSSVYSDDTEHQFQEKDTIVGTSGHSSADNPSADRDHTKIGTPIMGIAVSRRNVEAKRRSAVLEFEGQQGLARPSSSKSLRSLSGRPLSAGHRRYHSRHQHMRSLRLGHEDRAPFHRHEAEDNHTRSLLPAFHHDIIIDPDLAPFLSDDSSSEDEQVSIFAALNSESPASASANHDKGPFSSLFSSSRKGRSRLGDRGSGAHSTSHRDFDNASISSKTQRTHRRHNLSVSSITHPRPSPRRSKSNSLLKSIGAALGSTPQDTNLGPSNDPYLKPGDATMMTRSAAMQGEAAPAVELNDASLKHVRKLLRQLLQDSRISHINSWEKALMPILLQCTDDVNPDTHHRKDDIDIRHYIKLKKVPGGKPGDTSYVSGVVFSKNVALKSMARTISNPRTVIVTFALEYARHQQHFMSLEPVIAQEREYLKNLVNRIVALNPQVLLVEKHVARIALEYLEAAGIAVACNVKRSVLSAVARCTQTRMISSVDKLTLDSHHLGTCSSFDVKTYVHKGMKKTYLYFSGCQKDLGCTIVLRGAELPALRRLKLITEFMCYVVYSLKLETSLMRDESVLLPSSSEGGTVSPGKSTARQIADSAHNDPAAVADGIVQASIKLQEQIQESSENPKPYSAVTNTEVLGATAGSGGDSLSQSLGCCKASDTEVPNDDLPISSDYGDMVDQFRTRVLSGSPFVKFMQPYLLMTVREQERRIAYLKRLRDQYSRGDDTDDTEKDLQNFQLVKPDMVHTVVETLSRPVRDFLHAVHNAEYDKAMHNYLTQKRQWEAYLASNPNLFDPLNHQRIAFLFSVVNSLTSAPCIGPEIMALEYYNGHEFNDGFVTDCSLGQFVQELCMNVDTRCPGDRCHKTVLDHHRQYVHGGGKMSIIAQREPSKLRGMQNTILMWSCCRICGQETQVMPMSDNTWKYSFGKYLELTFWSMNLPPRTGVCAHDVHKNHVRYFGYNDVALRIQYDPIQLRDVVVPKPVVTWKVEADLKLKNEQFLKLEERLDKFMASVRARIKSIRVESVEPEKVEACRAEVERLMKRANNEHEVLKNKLKEKYLKSRYYEIIPLNRAGRFMHEKALVWDDMFLEFERMFFPSEKDIGRLAALQLRKIFLDRDESVTSLNSLDEPKETTPSVEEGSPDTKPKDEPSQVIPSSPSLSANAASDIMNSVVEKDRGAMEQSLDGEGTPRLPEIKVDTPSNAGQDQATPIVETPVQPVELEEVKHLDLVVSSKLAEKKPIITRQVTANTSIGDIPISGPSHVSHEGVTSLESTASGGGNQQVLPSSSHNETIQESRIPRPVDGFRRDLPQRPPLFPRAQSQPHNVLRREQSNNSTTPVSSTGYGNNLSTTEHPKHNLGDPARALEKRMADRLGLGNFKPGKFTQSFIPRSIPTKRNDTKVSSLTKYFDQLGREFEKERLRERRLRAAKSRQARALPLASAKPTVEIYRDPHQAALEQDDMDEDTSSPNRQSLETSTLEESTTTGTTDRTTELQSPAEPHHDDEATDRATDNEDHTLPSHQGSDVEGEASDVDHSVIEDLELPEGLEGQQIHLPTQSQLELNLELPKHQKSSIMKMLTSFWSERSASGWAPLEYPFASQEHFFDDSDIVIREDEPSSVIALALSCTDYMHKIHNWREEAKARARELSLNGQLEDEEEASIEHNFMGVNTNIKYGFPHRRVKVAIKIYYAQSFDALRRKCGVADRFVESMSRCLQWDSKGGKTKSVFLKTLDDRFVLKSLSPVEFEAFLNFAQHYFAFTHQNLYKGLPSVIAKMFGLYQVSIRNSATGNEFNHNLLVMENLFYDREPNMRFDLKGSMRNRKIQSTGERDEVLQDENLVDIIFEEPIFVREHTKKLLKASVWNDTLFLSKQNVMDYSLMAGFNNEHCEIVVGIIDCIRTYTWDKKLETWIKDRGKNKPTITSPKDYRARFRIAMNTYILQAPNCWHQFQGEYIQSRPVVWQADGRGLGKGKMIGGGVPAPPAIPPPNGATASGSKSNGKEREREEQEQEQEPGKFVTAPEGMAPAV